MKGVIVVVGEEGEEVDVGRCYCGDGLGRRGGW